MQGGYSSEVVLEVTVSSASNLKNVNWRNGALRPYAVLSWVDGGGGATSRSSKCSTHVADNNNAAAGDDDDDTAAVWVWDETLLVPLPSRLDDAVLRIDVVHAADPSSDAVPVDKPLVGPARLPLRDVLDDDAAAAALGANNKVVSRTLVLKRPSGRPQGRLDVRVRVRDSQLEAARYGAYGYDYPYPAPGGAGAVPYYGRQGAPAYGQPTSYAAPPAGYPAPAAAAQMKSSSKMGMATGVAVGAAAGLLGGLALAEGASYLEDSVAEKVQEDMFGADDGDDF